MSAITAASSNTVSIFITKSTPTHFIHIYLQNYNTFLGVDQYLAVLDPLEYNAKVTRGVSRKLISLVWILGISAAAIASSQLIWASEHSPWISCREAAASKSALAASDQIEAEKEATVASSTSLGGEGFYIQGRIW